MPRQVLEDGPTFKADYAVLLNGLPKVGAVIAKLVARYWSWNIVQWGLFYTMVIGKCASTYGPPSGAYELTHVSTCVALIAELTPGKVSSAL